MSDSCSCGCGGHGGACGCCAGVEPVTPLSVDNPPGQPQLVYRIGTHAAFFETMKARLPSVTVPVVGGEARPLMALRARGADDAAITLLDAWATVADVLAFYQERIANEGFLRTAVERRSLVELARLVGYRPKPGVAASTWLAYTLDTGHDVTLPAGSAVQSVPGPGALPQTFETAEPLDARSAFNALRPRAGRPLNLTAENAAYVGELYFRGITTNLRTGDVLLLVFAGDSAMRPLHRIVRDVEPHPAKDPLVDRPYTRVTLEATNESFALIASLIGEKYLALLSPWQSGSKDLGPFADGFHGAAAALRKVIADPGTAIDTTGKVVKRLRNLMSKAPDSFAEGPPVSLWVAETAQALDELLRIAPAPRAAIIPPDVEDAVPPKKEENGPAVAIAAVPPPVAATPARPIEAAFRESVRAQAIDGVIHALLRPAAATPVQWASTGLAAVFGSATSTSPIKGANTARPTGSWTDATLRLLRSLRPQLGSSVTRGLSHAPVAAPAPLASVYAFRAKAALFGSAAPLRQTFERGQLKSIEEWPLAARDVAINGSLEAVLTLDAQVDQLAQGGWVYIDRGFPGDAAKTARDGEENAVYARIDYARDVARANYGLAGKVTELQLDRAWRGQSGKALHDLSLRRLRRTTVHLRSERLELADVPIRRPVGGCDTMPAAVAAEAGVDPGPYLDGVVSPESATVIELDALCDTLPAGRRLIVTGERADLPGVTAAEAVILAGSTQGVSQTAVADDPTRLPLPADDPDTTDRSGDTLHTTLHLAAPGLAYCYKRETVRIHANVVPATHGETRMDVFGDGKSAAAWQSLALRQGPLTFVSAPTVSGVASTLALRVNDVLWEEAADLTALGPAARGFFTTQDDDGTTRLTFGDGARSGVRPPTGTGNLRVTYRVGLGRPGNLAAGQLSQLKTRPLGVKEVVNPLPPTGGADREAIDAIRSNAPRIVTSLGRLVSVEDYADFARTFGGITKATARLLPRGRRRVIHVTVAGDGPLPLADGGDVCRNLHQALVRFGDPRLPVVVRPHEAKALLLDVAVSIDAGYLWADVETRCRAALGGAFGFESRDLGEDLARSQIVATLQRQSGVTGVSVIAFAALGLRDLASGAFTNPLNLAAGVAAVLTGTPADSLTAELDRVQAGKLMPSQLICFAADPKDTLQLREGIL